MTSNFFLYEEFTKYIPVPRETHTRLKAYVELLKKWQSAINLVGKSTIEDIWSRHIIDSAQLIKYIPTQETILDVGSGAGLPGLILAMLGVENITLVESDGRKIAFLKEAARITQTPIEIMHKRVEDIDINKFSLVVGRAFAPLDTLIGVFTKGLKTSHKMLLLKGKNYMSELEKAQVFWTFDYTVFPSAVDPDGVILSLKNFQKK